MIRLSSMLPLAGMQLFHPATRSFEWHTRPVPGDLAPGEVLVKISLATVCGSDLHTVDGRRTAPAACVLGHEAIGHVIASAREGVAEGRRVTWSLADSCGRCPACERWRLPQKCGHLFKYGHAALSDGSGLNGCYSTHILLRAGTAIFPVPDVLPDALVAPANCALATIVNALSDLPPDCESALVQGGGLLGIYACAWLRQQGVPRVFCVDVDPQRLSLVKAFGGIPLSALPETWKRSAEIIRHHHPEGVDLAIEVAGTAAVVPQGIELLRPGGVYVWAGMVHPQTALELTGEQVIRKCLTVRGVHNYQPRHLAEGLAFLEATFDRLPYETLVSPPLPLASLGEAIDLTRRREWLRVAVQPDL